MCFYKQVVNLETHELCEPREQGEIRLKGECLMNGYYNNPKESSNIWDEDGFLKTGDIGYYDENECFYIIDRIKDMIKYQSWHVSQ